MFTNMLFCLSSSRWRTWERNYWACNTVYLPYCPHRTLWTSAPMENRYWHVTPLLYVGYWTSPSNLGVVDSTNGIPLFWISEFTMSFSILLSCFKIQMWLFEPFILFLLIQSLPGIKFAIFSVCMHHASNLHLFLIIINLFRIVSIETIRNRWGWLGHARR